MNVRIMVFVGPYNNLVETEATFPSRNTSPGRTSLTKGACPPSADSRQVNESKEGKLTKVLAGTGSQNLKGASKRPLLNFVSQFGIPKRAFVGWNETENPSCCQRVYQDNTRR
jgi:hypothetical protein